MKTPNHSNTWSLISNSTSKKYQENTQPQMRPMRWCIPQLKRALRAVNKAKRSAVSGSLDFGLKTQESRHHTLWTVNLGCQNSALESGGLSAFVFVIKPLWQILNTWCVTTRNGRGRNDSVRAQVTRQRRRQRLCQYSLVQEAKEVHNLPVSFICANYKHLFTSF